MSTGNNGLFYVELFSFAEEKRGGGNHMDQIFIL